ncbi:hypothetical protein NX059_005983 [Plenodomus lindquistii]|nr:hypothetical protein NX059_005983 [Plenodomus lindquistii]
MDQLRSFYRNGGNGDNNTPMNADLRTHRVFLVADDDVLSDTDNAFTIKHDCFTVKCVEADYEAANHVGDARRCMPQRYFGWMPMRAGYVIELWRNLRDHEMQTIAPEMIGGESFGCLG